METKNEALHPQFRQPDVSGSINLSVEAKISIKKECLSQAIRICQSSSETATGISQDKSKSESVLEVAKKFEQYLLN